MNFFSDKMGTKTGGRSGGRTGGRTGGRKGSAKVYYDVKKKPKFLDLQKKRKIEMKKKRNV